MSVVAGCWLRVFVCVCVEKKVWTMTSHVCLMCSGLHADTEIGRYTQMHSDTQRRMQATMEGGKGSLLKYRWMYQLYVIWVESDKSQEGERQGIIVRNGVEIFNPHTRLYQ